MFAILLVLVPNSHAFAAPSESVTVPGGLTFWFHDVVRDKTVSLSIVDFPNDDQTARFRVELGRIGNDYDPIIVGYLEDRTQEFIVTYNIPYVLQTEFV